jgi:phosphoribosylanthranilate isomerase
MCLNLTVYKPVNNELPRRPDEPGSTTSRGESDSKPIEQGATSMENVQNPSRSPQVKICGLTRVHEAVTCASLGADAIGFVFYPRSPRAVTLSQAKAISLALPLSVCRVGVFVNETYDTILHAAATARLQAVQLHGMESPELVEKIGAQGLMVIKALFSHREPFFSTAGNYKAAAFIVECGVGPLPGGNARAWDVSLLKAFSKDFPLVLAGGLAIDNVARAISQGQPDAVDISSGVEQRPGVKDLFKVKQFIAATQNKRLAKPNRRIFYVDQ